MNRVLTRIRLVLWLSLVLGGVSWVGQKAKNKVFEFPSETSIARLEAEVFSYPGLLDDKLPRIRSFEIPPKEYSRFARFFTDPTAVGRRELSSKLHTEAGSLLVIMKSGDSYRIPFYSNGGDKGPLYFSVKGHSYHSSANGSLDNSHALDMTIRRVFEAMTGYSVTLPINKKKEGESYSPKRSEGRYNPNQGTPNR